LLDSRRMTNHVVAEVSIDGRWIVVDPAFRAILRGSDGGLLTRKQLTDPSVFAAATQSIRGYDPTYTYADTTHVRLSRIPFIGRASRRILAELLPGWDESTTMTLLLERQSLVTMVLAFIFVFLLTLLRVGLRWYGEHRLGVRPLRIRQQLRRALHAFVDTSS
jgi:hypothetical protein